MSEKLHLNWQDIQYLVQNIVREIQNSGWRPDIVIGIDRGGLIASVMISHYLNVPHENVKVSLRSGSKAEAESLLWAPEDAIKGMQILLVDDINDTGETQRWIREDWASSVAGVDPFFAENIWHGNVRWASLVENTASKERSDFFGQSIDKSKDDVWIDFPWESWWQRSTL